MLKPTARRPANWKDLHKELREIYGGNAMSFEEVKDALGLSSYNATMSWIKEQGIEAFVVNGRNRFLASDIAKAIERAKVAV